MYTTPVNGHHQIEIVAISPQNQKLMTILLKTEINFFVRADPSAVEMKKVLLVTKMKGVT